VVDLADAVATVFPHHAEAFPLGDPLDGVADIAQRGARAHPVDACAPGLAGGADKPARQGAGPADVEHAAGVTEPAVFDQRHVDVEDVAVFQLTARRDAVADHLVHRRADGLRVADVGRDRLEHVDDVVVAGLVQRIGAHTRPHVPGDHLQHIGGQAAGAPRHGDLGRRAQPYVPHRPQDAPPAAARPAGTQDMTLDMPGA